jgi:hypothetical protein
MMTRVAMQMAGLLEIAILLGATGAVASGAQPARGTPDAQGRYEATWESLDSRPVPAWWTDAKFGVYVHWTLAAVPARLCFRVDGRPIARAASSKTRYGFLTL